MHDVLRRPVGNRESDKRERFARSRKDGYPTRVDTMTMIRIGRMVVLTILVLSAYWGFTNGPAEVARGTTLQRLVGAGQIAYAVAALLGVLALWFKPRWAVHLSGLWAILVTLTTVV